MHERSEPSCPTTCKFNGIPRIIVWALTTPSQRYREPTNTEVSEPWGHSEEPPLKTVETRETARIIHHRHQQSETHTRKKNDVRAFSKDPQTGTDLDNYVSDALHCLQGGRQIRAWLQ